MALEIEVKYLVGDLAAVSALTPKRTEQIIQAYLTRPGDGAAIRVRASVWENGHEEAFITVKTSAKGMTRGEWEYPIPLKDAQEMMALAEGRFITKTRYFFEHTNGQTIEVDIFDGDLAGLVVAEIEVKSEDEHIDIPSWFGANVTDDVRYSNIHLALHGLPVPPHGF